MKDATLRPKHRVYRQITKEFLKRQEKLEKKTRTAKRRNNKSFVKSISNIAEWLNSTTIVMSSYTDTKAAREEEKLWR
jgi:hypothetical protein